MSDEKGYVEERLMETGVLPCAIGLSPGGVSIVWKAEWRWVDTWSVACSGCWWRRRSSGAGSLASSALYALVRGDESLTRATRSEFQRSGRACFAATV